MPLNTRFFKSVTLAAAFALGIAAGPAQAAGEENWVFAGTIEINTTQMAFIISGKAGGGVLEFEGKEHAFNIGGLGVGGIGVQTLNAVGAVYNMTDISQFAGTYVQARAGATLGKGASAMRLSNNNGVILDLKSSNRGAALSLGVDGLIISLK